MKTMLARGAAVAVLAVSLTACSSGQGAQPGPTSAGVVIAPQGAVSDPTATQPATQAPAGPTVDPEDLEATRDGEGKLSTWVEGLSDDQVVELVDFAEKAAVEVTIEDPEESSAQRRARLRPLFPALEDVDQVRVSTLLHPGVQAKAATEVVYVADVRMTSREREKSAVVDVQVSFRSRVLPEGSETQYLVEDGVRWAVEVTFDEDGEPYALEVDAIRSER